MTDRTSDRVLHRAGPSIFARPAVRGFVLGFVGYGLVQVVLYVVRSLVDHPGRPGDIAIVVVAALGLLLFGWATALLFEYEWRHFGIGLMVGVVLVFALDAIPVVHFALTIQT